MKLFETFHYENPREILSGITVTFHDAGHVLGSAMVEVVCRGNGTSRRFLEGGDLGRVHMPILRDPWQPGEFDVVMMESTYGNRDHDPIDAMDARPAQIIRDTSKRGGKIIVPSFALERAQEIVYALRTETVPMCRACRCMSTVQ